MPPLVIVIINLPGVFFPKISHFGVLPLFNQQSNTDSSLSIKNDEEILQNFTSVVH